MTPFHEPIKLHRQKDLNKAQPDRLEARKGETFLWVITLDEKTAK